MAARQREFQVYVSLSDAVVGAGREHLVRSSAWRPHGALQDVYVTECCSDLLREECLAWIEHLQPGDVNRIRCHISTKSNLPSPGNLMHSRDLQWLLEWLNGRWLHELLARERLVTFFQPIVEVASRRRVFAFECLSRARGEHGELIPPDQLFQAARATGQLSALDVAAQFTAVRSAARQKLDTCIFINISPRCLDHSAEVLQRTISLSQEEGLPSDRLVFEVVESDKLDDLDLLMRVLQFCRSVGSRVALDDVGAGYNSLALMAEVRPDFIKIDRALIRGVDHDVFKCRVVSKLIELARDLRIATVVEGIETEAEWDWVHTQGAEYGQGFLLGRPCENPIGWGGLPDPPKLPDLVNSTDTSWDLPVGAQS
ncbi:MAG TPA: EAL domain-containing protein [Pirellulaceae bacterium]